MAVSKRNTGCFDGSWGSCVSLKSCARCYLLSSSSCMQMINIKTEGRLALNTRLKCIKHLCISKYYHCPKLSGSTMVLVKKKKINTVSCFIILFYSFYLFFCISSFFFSFTITMILVIYLFIYLFFTFTMVILYIYNFFLLFTMVMS